MNWLLHYGFWGPRSAVTKLQTQDSWRFIFCPVTSTLKTQKELVCWFEFQEWGNRPCPIRKAVRHEGQSLTGGGRSILCSAQDFNWSDKAHSHYGVWSALVQYITSWPHPEIASQTDSASCVTKFLGTTQPRQSTWLRNSTEIIHFSDLTTPSSPTPTMLVRNLHLSQILLLSSPRACGASRAC